MLLAGVVVVACGSDDDKVISRDGGGAGGQGGDGFVPAAGGGEMQPELGGNGGELSSPSGGMGGEPVAVAGMGGEPVGMAGTPQISLGGAGGDFSEGGAGGAPVALNCDAIVIQDPKLEAALRVAIGKPDGVILPADVASLTTLGTHEVATLAGIECLSNLTDLSLNANAGAASTVSDLTPLSFLKKLVALDLTRIDPDNLAPLAEVPTLKVLRLTDAIRGQDLSPLGAANALEELWLDNNVVEDLSALANIATLKTLSLDSSTLNVPASVNTLKNIAVLSVENTPLSLANVNALTQLQELYASGSAPAWRRSAR